MELSLPMAIENCAPFIGADTPIAKPAASTRNTETMTIFQ
jgi:hypothetical protein